MLTKVWVARVVIEDFDAMVVIVIVIIIVVNVVVLMACDGIIGPCSVMRNIGVGSER